MSNFNYYLCQALKGEGAQEVFYSITENPLLNGLSELEWFELFDNLEFWLAESSLDRRTLLEFCQRWVDVLPENYSYNLNVQEHNIYTLRSILKNWISKYTPAAIKNIEYASRRDKRVLASQTIYYQKEEYRINNLYNQYKQTFEAYGYVAATIYALIRRYRDDQLPEMILALHHSLYDSFSHEQILQIAEYGPNIYYTWEVIKLCRSLKNLSIDAQSIAIFMSKTTYEDMVKLSDTIERFKEKNLTDFLRGICAGYQNSDLLNMNETLEYYEYLFSSAYSTDMNIAMATIDCEDYDVQDELQNLAISHNVISQTPTNLNQQVYRTDVNNGKNFDIPNPDDTREIIKRRLETRKEAREQRAQLKKLKLEALKSCGFDTEQSLMIQNLIFSRNEDVIKVSEKCVRLRGLGYTSEQLLQVLEDQRGIKFLDDLLENSEKLINFGIERNTILTMLKRQNEEFSLEDLVILRERQKIAQVCNQVAVSHSQLLQSNSVFFFSNAENTEENIYTSRANRTYM